MDDSTEAGEGIIWGSNQLSKELYINTFIILACIANGIHLSYCAITDIACKLFFSKSRQESLDSTT